MQRRSNLSPSLLPIAATILFCAAGCGSSSSQPDGGTVCVQGSTTCGAGTQCTDSVCTPTCAGGAGCGAGFYCESPTAPLDVCSPVTTPTCASNNDCPAPQICSGAASGIPGLCVSNEVRANGSPNGCFISDPTGDGCAYDALCYQVYNAGIQGYLNECVGLAHCSEGGGCPVSAAGAVCNQLPDGGLIFANKERLCLYGFCTGGPNCAAGAECFFADLTAPAGQCQLGVAGDGCYTNADCPNSVTGCEFADGGLDDAGTLGVCQ